MKSFKTHLIEEKKIYTRKEMIEWCLYNIDHFDITLERDNPKYLRDGQSAEGFSIIESKQLVRMTSPQRISIVTDDSYLPFTFDVYNGLSVEAVNLNQFSFTCVPKSDITKPQFAFINTDKLDFSTLDYYTNIDLYLRHLSNIHPQQLIKTRYAFLNITECDSKHVHDFSNYDNMSVKRFTLYALRPITNLTNLIEKENINIIHISINSLLFKSATESSELNNILISYLVNSDKKEFIMDFTVEMIDAGFEDML